VYGDALKDLTRDLGAHPILKHRVADLVLGPGHDGDAM
jgi:hypothetical protein